jgi:hypothetical protein
VVGAIVTATSLFAKEVFGDTGEVIGSPVAWTGAIVAAGAAWLQTKQHSNLVEAYSVAALELSAINDRIPVQSRRELGTVCQHIRGRDLPRAHAVAGPENYEVVGARGETTTHCGRLDSRRMILAAVADEVYCVIRYDKHKVLMQAWTLEAHLLGFFSGSWCCGSNDGRGMSVACEVAGVERKMDRRDHDKA